MDISNIGFAQVDGPGRVAIYSDEGWGKTTLLCNFPAPVIIGAEQGVPRDIGFPVSTVHPRSWMDVFDVVGSLTKDAHDYQTLGIDTVDWLEPLIHRFALERDSKRQTEVNPKGRLLESIEDYGFGKGYLIAEEEFRKLISVLDVLQARRGMNIVMLMHSKVKTFKNPSGPDYDRWEPKTHERISRVIIEWAENVLFGYFEINASKNPDDKERHKMAPDKARAKGFGGGVRLIGTQKNALYDAKNRVKLPPEMLLEDPRDLVPMLLGQHLEIVKLPDDARSGRHAREINWQGSPTGYDAPVDSRDKTDTGRPAMSTAERQEDEKRRAAEAFERTRKVQAEAFEAERERDRLAHERAQLAKVAAPDVVDRAFAGPSSDDTAKTDARTWTEPKTRAKPDAEHALMQRLTDTITAAGKAGDVYRKRVEGWVAKANGEHSKIEAIIGQVVKDLAASTNNQPRA